MITTEIYNILLIWIRNVLEPTLVVGENPIIPVIRGEQSAPRPKSEYIVIHQPMSRKEYASGNFWKGDKTVTGVAPNQVITTKVDYAKHWQATISIEEVGFLDNGDKLQTLLDSLNLQTQKDYFRTSKISILRCEGINPIPSVSENIWELRSNMDLIVLYPTESSYDPSIIETVESTGTYT